MCEPCMPGTYCPPCILPAQIVIATFGIISMIYSAILLFAKYGNKE